MKKQFRRQAEYIECTAAQKNALWRRLGHIQMLEQLPCIDMRAVGLQARGQVDLIKLASLDRLLNLLERVHVLSV